MGERGEDATNEPRCSCICLREQTHLEPAEWEQDPFCSKHPAVEGQIGMIQHAWTHLDAEPKKRLESALAALLDRQPTMTGCEIADALADGAVVEVLTSAGWDQASDGMICAPMWKHRSSVHLVARIVPPPAVPVDPGDGGGRCGPEAAAAAAQAAIDADATIHEAQQAVRSAGGRLTFEIETDAPAPPAPGDGLPEGIVEIEGRCWLAWGHALPEGWEWHQGPDDPQWITSPVKLIAGRIYEVRPATVEVEPWEALRDRRVVLIPGGTNHLDLGSDDKTEQQRVGALAASGAIHPASGRVTVLAEDGK